MWKETHLDQIEVVCVWNVMAHAQKTDFVFRPFKSVGASVQSIAGSRDVRISGSNAGYTTFGGSVRLLAAQFHLTSPPVCHRVPLGFKRAVPSYIYLEERRRNTKI
jgi:hypothetical protein